MNVGLPNSRNAENIALDFVRFLARAEYPPAIPNPAIHDSIQPGPIYCGSGLDIVWYLFCLGDEEPFWIRDDVRVVRVGKDACLKNLQTIPPPRLHAVIANGGTTALTWALARLAFATEPQPHVYNVQQDGVTELSPYPS
jgi:hypothetical protein